MGKKEFPKPIDPSIITRFNILVKTGQYCLYPSSNIPAGIPTAGSDCQAVVVAASVFYESDVPGLPQSMIPSGTVYLWRGFRTKASDDPPRKVDDCLYFVNSKGQAWSVHFKDSPDHHNNILSSTDMKGLINDWDLPTTSKGQLKQYREKGALLDFKEPFRENKNSS